MINDNKLNELKSTFLKGNIENELFEFSDGSVRYYGYINEVVKLIEKNQLMDEKLWKIFVEQFRNVPDDTDNGWRCEYWGKMMRGACMTYNYTHSRKLYKILTETIKDMLSAQDEYGRFSTYSIENEFHGWDMWGRKYILLGMMYYFDICTNKGLKKKILKAIIKHADYIIKHIGKGKSKIEIIKSSSEGYFGFGGMNSCSILEPFVKLYNLTSNDKYIKFAKYIIDTGFCEFGNLIDLAYDAKLPPFKYPVTKAYEMMSCFEGLLEYYRITKEDKYLQTVVNFVDSVKNSDITIIGCAGCKNELFDNAAVNQTEYSEDIMQETCVTVTWMKICYRLLCLTGKSKYAGYIENSGLNAMLGAVNKENNKKNGGLPFDSYSPLYMNKRARQVGGYKNITNDRFYGCCACIGSAGTALIENFGILMTKNGFAINLYNNATAKFKTPEGKDIKLKINANLFTDNKVNIVIGLCTAEKFEIKLRIPDWSKKTKVTINKINIDNVNNDEYLVIDRIWQNDDIITIQLDNRVKLIELNNKVAIVKGVIVLARDENFKDDIKQSVAIIHKNGIIKAKRINDPSLGKLVMEIPLKNGKYIRMVDYSSAGKKWDIENSMITVWMDKIEN